MLLINRRADGTWRSCSSRAPRQAGDAAWFCTPARRAAVEEAPDEPVTAEVVDVTPAGGRVVRFSAPIEGCSSSSA